MDIHLLKIGFWAGITAFASATLYLIFQAMQLYGLLTYPADEIYIYSASLCIVIPFLVEMLILYHTTPENKKFWAHAALLFTTMYAVFVTANYVVQLATVIPQTVSGKLDEVRLLQQTPHSMYWDFDALGYIFMGLASLISIPLFEMKGFQKLVKVFFIANAAVTPLIAVVYFYPKYSYNLLILALPWAITAPGSMLLLGMWFKKKLPGKQSAATRSAITPIDVASEDQFKDKPIGVRG